MANNPASIVSNNPNGSIFNAAFLHGAAERASKSAAQGFLSGFGMAELGDAVIPAADALNGSTWSTALMLALTMAVLSLATSVMRPEFVAGRYERVQVPVPTAAGPAPATIAATSAVGSSRATAAPPAEDEGPKHLAE